jgi:glycosidase
LKAIAYPPSILQPNWWETAAAITRPYLKAKGIRLSDLTASLDVFQSYGIDVLEVFAPLAGGVCYNGLDTIDFYQIDPALGTLTDLEKLILEAHTRGIAVVLFINLGYSHEQYPAFLRACDDVKAGIESAETQMFLWSKTGQDKMDRSRAPYFMNDSHGSWRWSERAGKFFWVKWEGEKGGYHLPQFNFGDPGWQETVRRILRFWLAKGIDGLVIDAVNWYIDCTWEICRASMTDVIHEADNQFCQPEGAGGFRDDPVEWVTRGGWNCIMDYSIKLWWEGVDVIRDAILSGDPRPVEVALQSYRDRVVAAGGVCYIDPPDLTELPVAPRLLGTALTATMGELMIMIGSQTSPEPESYRDGLTELLHLRKRYPAVCATGTRTKLPTSDDVHAYCFLRELPGAESVLAVFNFQPTPQHVTIDLTGQHILALNDLRSGEIITSTGDALAVNLLAYEYRFFSLNGKE